MATVVPTTAPVPITIGSAAVPNIPRPKAPNDWRPLNAEPAATKPMPDWIPAAVEPAATPAAVKPADDIATDDAILVPSAIPVAISPSLVAYFAMSDPILIFFINIAVSLH